MPIKRIIYLVDDDGTVCHALSVFLERSGYSVRSFLSAETFLEETEDTVECVMLLDQRMTEMSGLELQAELARRGIALPIIFITGHGDVQMSVEAIKAGAIDFLEKPLNNEGLLVSIREAFARADDSKKDHGLFAEIRLCYANLTTREREVVQHVVAGMPNRKLAGLLGLSNRTIGVHRSRAMEKMRAESIPDLVRKYAVCQKDNL